MVKSRQCSEFEWVINTHTIFTPLACPLPLIPCWLSLSSGCLSLPLTPSLSRSIVLLEMWVSALSFFHVSSLVYLSTFHFLDLVSRRNILSCIHPLPSTSPILDFTANLFLHPEQNCWQRQKTTPNLPGKQFGVGALIFPLASLSQKQEEKNLCPKYHSRITQIAALIIFGCPKQPTVWYCY